MHCMVFINQLGTVLLPLQQRKTLNYLLVFPVETMLKG